MEHLIEPSLLGKRVVVHLVGVGGNGAQMAACLARLDIAMRALGHPHGLHVTAFDGDAVSEANVGRQVYSPADVGQNKALLQITRLNQFYGLDWDAFPVRYDLTPADFATRPDIVVSCVDSKASRQQLHRALLTQPCGTAYWLDLGNMEATGQVVLGEPYRHPSDARDGSPRLPCVTELFPQLLDTAAPEDNAPSCSVRVSLASQGLFINDVIVRIGAHLLYELFSLGRLRQHGAVVNLDAKRCGPIDVNPLVWDRFGFRDGRQQGPTVAPGSKRKSRSMRDC
jgi:PRTRC genetic system ThiF family protein